MATADDERDYRALVTASFDADDPDDPEIREALLVHADRMQRDGDPRGAIITLAAGRVAARERAQRVAIDRELAKHARAHGEALFGPLAPQLEGRHALRLTWRGGYVYGALLDARYTRQHGKLTVIELVDRALDAPAMSEVRRLYIRVRTSQQAHEAVVRVARRPNIGIEMLVAGVSGRARQLATATHTTGAILAYPRLRMLGIDDVVVPLPIVATSRHVPEMIGRIATVVPFDADGQTAIARALTAPEPTVRAAALARVATLGAASRRYLDLLVLLLSPGFMRGHEVAVLECLERLGAHAAPIATTIAAMTGRVRYHDQAARERAGLLRRSLAHDMTAR